MSEQSPKMKKVRRRMSKRGVALSILLPLLILAVAFVALLPAIKTWFPPAGTVAPVSVSYERTLLTSKRQEIATIQVRHADGTDYLLKYLDNALYLEDENGQQRINEAIGDTMLNVLATLQMQLVISEDPQEVQEHLEEMGLKPPAITVDVKFEDGRAFTLRFGKKVPGESGYYFRWSGDENVYMCDAGMYQSFEYSSKMLLPVEQPVISIGLIDTVGIRLRGKEAMAFQFVTDSAGQTGGKLVEPYAYPMSADATKSIITALSDFRLGTIQGKVTPENEADYGFDDPLAVLDIRTREGAFTEVDATGALQAQTIGEQVLRITLGRAESDYFYTCEYEGGCYLVSRFLVEALLKITPESVLTRYPADMGTAIVSGVKAQTGAGVLDFRATRTERVLPNNQLEMDAEGNTVYDVSVRLNESEISAEAFDGLLQRLSEMRVSGDIPSEFTVGTTAPRWQLTLTTLGGTTRVLKAYPLDTFTDALEVDGLIRHTIHVESLEIALAEFNAD